MTTTTSGTPIIHISDTVYAKLAAELRENIGDHGIYTGTVYFDNKVFSLELDVTLIIYYMKQSYPDGDWMEIEDVAPVWWSAQTWRSDDGELVPNDFDFAKLKNKIVWG